MSKTVWKVCRTEGDKLFSCFAWGKSRLEYQRGEWTEASEGTKLFVFKNLESAEDFVQEYTIDNEMWSDDHRLIPLRAIAQGIEEAPLGILGSWLTGRSSIITRFWDRTIVFEGDLRPTPPGTVLCQKVKLERKANGIQVK